MNTTLYHSVSVVTGSLERSAKPLCVGSIPTRASIPTYTPATGVFRCP